MDPPLTTYPPDPRCLSCDMAVADGITDGGHLCASPVMAAATAGLTHTPMYRPVNSTDAVVEFGDKKVPQRSALLIGQTPDDAAQSLILIGSLEHPICFSQNKPESEMTDFFSLMRRHSRCGGDDHDWKTIGMGILLYMNNF